jgi:hypothetical protein
MHLYALYELSRSARVRRVVARARAEFIALAGALLSPGKLVAEVEALHKLKRLN